MSKIPVVTISGTTHGGTTLLDLLVSGHSLAVSVGEALFQEQVFQGPCCCGESVSSCSYWIAINKLLQRENKDLTTLERDVRRPEYAVDLASLYRAVLELSGASFVVDSSKFIDHIYTLRERNDLFSLRTIVINREAVGVASSHKRKNYSLTRLVRSYNRKFISHLLMWKDIDVFVSYEELTRDPTGVLLSTMTALGLPYEPEQLDWETTARNRHDLGGNRMRQRGGKIRYDASWKDRLTAAEKIWIPLAACPGQIAFRLGRTFRARSATFRPIVEGLSAQG